jgi:Zn-dependent peptidase ImmA (M78 family)
MAATQRSVVRKSKQGGGDLSFALDDNPQHSRLVLRSKWETGRRFELARLLGDRIAGSKGGQLFPATRAYTYRQKMQRSFAAEFLSPFDVIDEMLDGDYSMENQLEVAHHFRVSEWTIRIQLVNHGRLKREDDADLDAAA